jgi:EAL domain-containing protein (putative c-di-GMP-specific phosphodiesterase class I)
MVIANLPSGLPGWLLLSDRIEQAIRKTRREGGRIAVAVVHDLRTDAFAKLSASLRPGDTVTRLVDDRLVVLMPWLNGEGDLLVYVFRRMVGAGPCSTGVSMYPEDGDDAKTLLANADAALTRARAGAPNSVQFHSEKLNKVAAERLKREAELRRALEENQLELYYQPKISLADERITGAEALLRWIPPQQAPIPPQVFIRLAEECGLIDQIGEWVLGAACRQLQRWASHGNAPRVAVNVSPRQFTRPNLPGRIESMLHSAGVAPKSLQIEITETSLAEDQSAFLHAIDNLKHLGLQIAIDDFGTGYSSLSYLKSIPVDEIKIDRSFISDLESDPKSRAIVKAVITLGHSLGLTVVAEGVETAPQRDILRASGCDDVQGFYFGRPLPAADFERMWRARGA